jgi:inorganic phosphate transporter, PiT family
MAMSITPLVMAAMAMSYAFDFFNGLHDAPNSISTVISTRVLSPATAVAMAGIFNLVAFLVVGTAVAQTIGEGIVRPEAMDVRVIIAALVGAMALGLASWRLELPTSSSHALIGGLLGAAVAKGGLGSLQGPGLEVVVLFMFLSPLLGFVGAASIMALVVRAFSRRPQHEVHQHFRRLQLVSSSLVSLSHGANDGQKTMGIVAALLVATGNLPSFSVPLWVILSAQLTIALGTVFGGWGVVRTLGSRLAKMDPVRGVSIETSAAAVILSCSLLGIPVSTTQCVSGAVMGSSATMGASRVRWSVARSIGVAWVLTVPVAALIAAAAYLLISAPI